MGKLDAVSSSALVTRVDAQWAEIKKARGKDSQPAGALPIPGAADAARSHLSVVASPLGTSSMGWRGKIATRLHIGHHASVPWLPIHVVEAEHVLSNKILGHADVLRLAGYFSDWRSAFEVLLEALKEAYDTYSAAIGRQKSKDTAMRDFTIQQVTVLTKRALTTFGFGPITELVAHFIDTNVVSRKSTFSPEWYAKMHMSSLSGSITASVTKMLASKLSAKARYASPSISLKEYKFIVLNALSDINRSCSDTVESFLDGYKSRESAEELLMAVHLAESTPGAPLTDDALVARLEKYCAELHEETMGRLKAMFWCPTKLTMGRRKEMVQLIEEALWAEFIGNQEKRPDGNLKAPLGSEPINRLVALGVVARRASTNILGLDITGAHARAREQEAASEENTIFVGRHKVGKPGHSAILNWAETFDMNQAFCQVLGISTRSSLAFPKLERALSA